MEGQVKVVALGGVGEIGKNMYVVEVGDEIFVIDAGLKFPESDMYGVDLVIPDVSYLIANRQRVKGIFLTHGHEDHIGAIPYIVNRLNVPVYGTRLTIGFVKERLEKVGVSYRNLHEIHADSLYQYQQARVSFFKTSHSIPDSVGVVIHTPQGAVVYTGDFKLDSTPVNNNHTEIWKISALGNEGVLCLLSDSTNAEKPGFTPSERIVSDELSKAIYQANGRIIIASFASNIHRIQQIMNAAHENHKKLAIVGQSMYRAVEIAQSLGYLTIPKDLVISSVDIGNYPESKIVILTTGSQGEPMAALTRMAQGQHGQVKIKKSDTIIIAASPIPGNEVSVGKTVNLLSRTGATVVFKDRQVHVSGHGSQEELKLMIQMMKPANLIPVHGEYRMQVAHKKLGKQLELQEHQIHVLERGDVIEFRHGEVSGVSRVQTGNVLIDGLGVGDIGTIVLRDRKLLSQDGILIVGITIDTKTKKIISGPEITSRGFIYVKEEKLLLELVQQLVQKIVTDMLEKQMSDWATMKGVLRDGLTQLLYEKTKRRPMILPIIMEV